jgi:hypothetical protein
VYLSETMLAIRIAPRLRAILLVRMFDHGAPTGGKVAENLSSVVVLGFACLSLARNKFLSSSRENFQLSVLSAPHLTSELAF